MTVNPHTESKTPRQHWMSVLARASLKDLEQAIASLGPTPDYVVMKPAETGTIMLEDLSIEMWQNVVNVNLSGVFYCMQEAFRMMKEQSLVVARAAARRHGSRPRP